MGYLGFGNSAEFTDSEMQLMIDVIFNYEKTLNITDTEKKKKALLDYVLREMFDTAKLWATENPDVVQNALEKYFGKEDLKKSGLTSEKLIKEIDVGEQIIDLTYQATLFLDGYFSLQEAEVTDNAQMRRDAMQQMMDSTLYACNWLVQKVPVIGTTLSAIVYNLNICFDAAYNIIDMHLNALEYTDLMCDYYVGIISTQELVNKLSQLKYMPEDKLKELQALANMESKFSESDRKECYSNSDYSNNLDTWLSRGETHYNHITDDEKEQYNGRWKGSGWTNSTAEDTTEDTSENYDDSSDAEAPRDPLVIDLGKQGIELTDVENGVHFDLDKNELAEKTAWIGTEDGFLVLERNGNGIIDNGGELFGDQVVMSNGVTASSGFEALTDLDDNANESEDAIGDGIIDEKDAEFSNLRVWVDKDHDGITDEGELKTVLSMIFRISLNTPTSCIWMMTPHTASSSSMLTAAMVSLLEPRVLTTPASHSSFRMQEQSLNRMTLQKAKENFTQS